MKSAAGSVATSVFEGPIEVLLKLVVTREVDIYDITLTEIIQAFCDRIAQLEDSGDPSEATDTALLDEITAFLVPVATMLELKSRRLLPIEQEDDLEAELAAYAHDEISLARLIEGHNFVTAARRLRSLVAAAALHRQRITGADERFAAAAQDPLESSTAQALAAALRAVLERPAAVAVDISHIAAPPITVEECAADLVRQLPALGRVSFAELTGHYRERVVVVSYFLALLELFRLGHLELSQVERFGDIEIIWLGAETLGAGGGASVVAA